MMDKRPCAWCGKPLTTPYPTKLTCSPKCHAERARQMERERRPRKIACRRCGGPMPDIHDGVTRYCSDACRFNTAESVEGGTPCANPRCGRLFAQNPKSLRPQLYCGKVCRRAAFKARHSDDERGGEEIPVKDLEESPRRLAVAKLFDRYEGGGAFDHFTPLQWMNPANRRASR